MNESFGIKTLDEWFTDSGVEYTFGFFDRIKEKQNKRLDLLFKKVQELQNEIKAIERDQAILLRSMDLRESLKAKLVSEGRLIRNAKEIKVDGVPGDTINFVPKTNGPD